MFADRLKELRAKNHLTQSDLGEMCDVSNVSIYKWETGRVEPDISNIKRLSEIFGVSVDYLIGASDEPQQQKVQTDERLQILNELNALETDKLAQVLEYARFIANKK